MQKRMIRVWRVTPDPEHIFDHLIVSSAAEAGEAAARGAEQAWDEATTHPEEPGPPYAIQCFEMPVDEFEALPEP